MMSPLGELNSDDALSGRPLRVDPARLGGCDPVDARPPTAQGVADTESILVVPRARDGETCTDRVAGPEQCAEVVVVRHPQRSDDEMVPATMARRPALCSQ
jgi:hypothetical protein